MGYTSFKYPSMLRSIRYVNGSVSRSDGTVLLDVDIFILQDIVDLAGDWNVVDMHPSVATVVF